jgi:hypothetical protein
MSIEREEAGGDQPRKLSRSALLAGGGAAAAGFSIGRADSALAGVTPTSAEAGQIGIAPVNENALELVFRVDQVAERFTTYGYLTEIASLPRTALFSSANRRDDRTARFTLWSVTTMVNRSIVEGVHALHVNGPMDIYLRPNAGAAFGDPSSFREGELIASYHGEFQSIVSVTSPRKGIETLAGSLRQTRAQRFTFLGGTRVLGRRGLGLRVEATGAGTLLEPKRPRAALVLAGTVVVTS